MSAGHMKPTEAPSLNMVQEDLLLTVTSLTKMHVPVLMDLWKSSNCCAAAIMQNCTESSEEGGGGGGGKKKTKQHKKYFCAN